MSAVRWLKNLSVIVLPLFRKLIYASWSEKGHCSDKCGYSRTKIKHSLTNSERPATQMRLPANLMNEFWISDS